MSQVMSRGTDIERGSSLVPGVIRQTSCITGGYETYVLQDLEDGELTVQRHPEDKRRMYPRRMINIPSLGTDDMEAPAAYDGTNWQVCGKVGTIDYVTNEARSKQQKRDRVYHAWHTQGPSVGPFGHDADRPRPRGL